MDKRLLKATGQMYISCAKDAAEMLVKNWIVLIASIAAYFVYVMSVILFSSLGIAGGFLVGIVNIALLSYYYKWISECVRKNRLKATGYFEFDPALFSSVINAAFFLYIIVLVTSGLRPLWAAAGINLALFIFLNAIPEVLYLRGAQGLNAFTEAYSFIRDNWIEWFLPFILFFIPVLVQSPLGFLFTLTSADPLLPVLKFLVLAQSMMPVILVKSVVFVLSLIAATWFMIFRGFLFRELEFGSRRQRAFMSAQR